MKCPNIDYLCGLLHGAAFVVAAVTVTILIASRKPTFTPHVDWWVSSTNFIQLVTTNKAEVIDWVLYDNIVFENTNGAGVWRSVGIYTGENMTIDHHLYRTNDTGNIITP